MLSQALQRALKLQWMLQRAGFYVSRHASSMLIMYQDRILATVHVYADECRINIYKPWLESNTSAIEKLRGIVRGSCGKTVEKLVPEHSL